MSFLLEKFAQAIDRFGIGPRDKVLVAVSGGPDSVCLLHLLKNLPRPYQLDLHVAHLNHQFRPEANEEARFVASLAGAWALSATISAQPVAEICKEGHLSKQAGARRVRYAFLKETAKKTGCKWIALGHTADDQAETVLIRMLRGSGMTGLRGIPEVREGGIIRPLIDCHRTEIVRELSASGIVCLNDPSNQQTVYLRNKIRHKLIPVLETYNPNIKETLRREATLLAAEDDFMASSTLAQLPTLGTEIDDQGIRFDIMPFKQLHLALQRRVLRWGIEKLHHDLKGIAFKHIEVARTRVLSGRNGSRYQLPQGLLVEQQDSKLWIKHQDSCKRKEASGEIEDKECRLPELGEAPFRTVIDFPLWSLRLKLSLSSEWAHPFSACKASFDFDKIPAPLFIRGWRQGDRFVPLGMRGHHKKLQDFFVDAKIKRADRHHIPILSSSKDILWLIGHRVDARFCATALSLRVLIIEAETLTEA